MQKYVLFVILIGFQQGTALQGVIAGDDIIIQLNIAISVNASGSTYGSESHELFFYGKNIGADQFTHHTRADAALVVKIGEGNLLGIWSTVHLHIIADDGAIAAFPGIK